MVQGSNKEQQALREKYPYLEFFWSVFYRIRTEYEEIRSISPYSVQIRENVDQKYFEYGHFSRIKIVLLNYFHKCSKFLELIERRGIVTLRDFQFQP